MIDFLLLLLMIFMISIVYLAYRLWQLHKEIEVIRKSNNVKPTPEAEWWTETNQ